VANPKLAASTRARLEVTGWHLSIIHQVPQDDGRKLKRCPIPSDPWRASISDGPMFDAKVMRHGQGDTADAAVISAIPSDLRAALRRCEKAVDSLRDCLQK
jgi:hypothetical protein